jgi:predicted acylesterase/phospholipase RssA
VKFLFLTPDLNLTIFFSRSRQSSNPSSSKSRSTGSQDISQHFIKKSSKITPEKTISPKTSSFSPLEDVQLIDSSEDEDITQISMFQNTSDLKTQSLLTQAPMAGRGINARLECWLSKAQENTKKRKHASFSPKPVSSSR